MKQTRSPLYPIFLFVIINLIIFSLSRLGLAIWQADRVSAVAGWGQLFLQGLRMDIVALCYLFGVPALFTVLFHHSRIWKMILRIWLTLGSVFILFMELATPAFIETYDFRPNRLFIEYLIYPKEVFSMLMEGHLTAVIFSLIFTIAAFFCYWKLSGYAVKNLRSMSWKLRPVVALLVIAVAFLGARSSFQHRGVNPAMVAFSSDGLVNSLVLNSGYSVLYAAQQFKDEGASSEAYGKMDTDEMLRIVKASRGRPESDYISEKIPTLTKNQATYQGKPKNIVIILEESFGAQFVGTLGGKPISPEFDKLAKEGWLFENLYATGTRSVRGIEATTAGFTPTPARAVVKLNNSQSGFFTIADLLAKQGYNTSFIYGGEKHFDNMASFFYGNGFQKPKATRNNSAKYADYAIGYFFKLAKQSNYWKDTVFLVIADHDSRAAGASLVPIKHFHIPALILGDHVEPRRDSRLVSQIDMPTTLLSIAGVSGNYPMIGFDLTQEVNPDRAFMQFDQTQALMKGNHDVVIQTPNSKAKGYVYDKEKDTLTEKEVPEEMKKEALAHALLGSYLYKNRLYKGSEEK